MPHRFEAGPPPLAGLGLALAPREEEELLLGVRVGVGSGYPLGLTVARTRMALLPEEDLGWAEPPWGGRGLGLRASRSPSPIPPALEAKMPGLGQVASPSVHGCTTFSNLKVDFENCSMYCGGEGERPRPTF